MLSGIYLLKWGCLMNNFWVITSVWLTKTQSLSQTIICVHSQGVLEQKVSPSFPHHRSGGNVYSSRALRFVETISPRSPWEDDFLQIHPSCVLLSEMTGGFLCVLRGCNNSREELIHETRSIWRYLSDYIYSRVNFVQFACTAVSILLLF